LMTFYLDDKATPEQRDALEKVMHGMVGEKLAKKEEVKSAPITIVEGPKGQSKTVDVGTLVHYETSVSAGSHGRPATISNAPGALPFMSAPLTQGESKVFTVADGDTNWKYEGRNAF